MIIQPGTSPNSVQNFTTSPQTAQISPLDTLLDVIRNMFPENMVQASFARVKTKYNTIDTSLYSNASTIILEREIENVPGINILGIIVLCTVFGIMLSKFGEKAQVLIDIFILIDSMVMQIVSMVMWCAFNIYVIY